MEFNLTIPEEKAEIIIEAMCSAYNYKSIITEIVVNESGEESSVQKPNPEKPEDFAKRMVVEFIQTITKSYITDKAVAQARQEVERSIDLSGIN